MLILRSDRSPASLIIAFLGLGAAPNTFQKRSVSSAAAETTVVPSGFCKDNQQVMVKSSAAPFLFLKLYKSTNNGVNEQTDLNTAQEKKKGIPTAIQQTMCLQFNIWIKVCKGCTMYWHNVPSKKASTLGSTFYTKRFRTEK
jgi:hypothetical protein